jgi:hypothetical protein
LTRIYHPAVRGIVVIGKSAPVELEADPLPFTGLQSDFEKGFQFFFRAHHLGASLTGTRWISTRSDPHHRNKLALRMQKKMIRSRTVRLWAISHANPNRLNQWHQTARCPPYVQRRAAKL